MLAHRRPRISSISSQVKEQPPESGLKRPIGCEGGAVYARGLTLSNGLRKKNDETQNGNPPAQRQILQMVVVAGRFKTLLGSAVDILKLVTHGARGLGGDF